MTTAIAALPRLGGSALFAYRALWLAALAAALAALVASQLQVLAPARLLHAAILVAVATLLFKRRNADPVAAMLSIAFLIWAATASLEMAAMESGAIAIALLDRLRFLLFVVAMLLFPTGAFRPRWTRPAAAATLIVFAFGVLAALGLAPLALYQPLAMACAAAAAWAIRQRFGDLPPGIQRQQLKWVAFGIAAGLVLVAAARMLALAPGNPAGPWVRSLLFDCGVIAMALGVLVSLLRYRLYDADSAISRSTAYAVLTAILLAAFAGGEALVQALSQSWFGGNAGAISGGIAAALAAAMVAPLHLRVARWAEARFQKELATFRKEIAGIEGECGEMDSIQVLGGKLLEAIERALRPARSALIVEGRPVAIRHLDGEALEGWLAEASLSGEDLLQCASDDPLFPIRLRLPDGDGRAAGWILLGRRPDGSMHGGDEREAIAGAAGRIARAIRVVGHHEQRAAAEASRVRRVAARVRLLAKRIERIEARIEAAEQLRRRPSNPKHSRSRR